MNIRQKINETAIGMKKKPTGGKNPNRVKAAKSNWKSNRKNIVAGIKKFWNSAEGKALAKKLAAYRAKKESFEFEVENLIAFAEQETPEIVEHLQGYVENDLAGLEELMYVAEEMGEDMNLTEAVIKARKKHRVDPERSRAMKLARKKNKAAFARGAKKAVATKKANGTFKALGKFNSKQEGAEDVIAQAKKFLEGKKVNESEFGSDVHELYNQATDILSQLEEAIWQVDNKKGDQFADLNGRIVGWCQKNL